ncbi:methyltransferase-like protein 22 [Pecten maximus]|uniref:methyltransferase-like protein 22 n=1 Tax=Pecten maximus TaxID=6579 RepID=UPI001458F53E|nr:methyltransferase-like protein 22 [Pecten maximus]
MEPGEKVLSDVHLYHSSEFLSTKFNNSVTRFEIKLPSGDSDQAGDNAVQSEDSVDTTGQTEDRTLQTERCSVETDEDGDLILRRCQDNENTTVERDRHPCLETDEDGDLILQRCQNNENTTVERDRHPCLETDEDGDLILQWCQNNENTTVERDRHPCLETDEDGDLILQRCQNIENRTVITLEHSLATELKDVGEQVWAGALVLCDFILHHMSDFCQKVVLDLGAGTGLTTIVAAMTAKTVYCTDVGESVLGMALHNIQLNTDLTLNCDIVVRELDWCQGTLVQGKGKFQLTESDITDILQADIIIAADVIYDDGLTDALLNTIHMLMSQGPAKTLYMGLEKRLVFTLSDLDIVCPAYTHFLEGLNRLTQLGCKGRQLLYSKVDEDLPMYLNYNRTKQLEIWKIQSIIPNG